MTRGVRDFLHIIGVSVAVAAAILVASWATDTRRVAVAAPSAVGASAVKIWSASGLGTGFHIGQGLIVTAAHVVGAETEVKVKTTDGVEGTAKTLWTNKEYDIALLSTEDVAASASKLDCRVANVGETVEAVGNPSGLEFVHSWGRVSTRAEKRSGHALAFIADLSVAPGVSGGPVYAADGRVVGLVSAVATANLAMFPSITGYAYIVPSSAVCKLLGV